MCLDARKESDMFTLAPWGEGGEAGYYSLLLGHKQQKHTLDSLSKKRDFIQGYRAAHRLSRRDRQPDLDITHQNHIPKTQSWSREDMTAFQHWSEHHCLYC